MTFVVVTGGAGYIGSHTCKFLASEGYTPVVLDNLSRGHREFVKWGPLEEGDIADTDWVERMLEHYQPVAVLHFAGLAYVEESIAEPDRYYLNNVLGTLSVLQAMRNTGIKNIVFSSSCAVYGIPWEKPLFESSGCRPISPYGNSKLAAEFMVRDYARAFGMKYVVLRYFNAAGADPKGEIGERHEPEPHLIPRAFQSVVSGDRIQINGVDFETRDGTCERDYVHVMDLARAHHLALERLLKGYDPKDLQTFNLGAGVGVTVMDVLNGVSKICEKEVLFRIAPRRPGDPGALVAESKMASDHLHWIPQYDLDDILITAWNWHTKGKKSDA